MATISKHRHVRPAIWTTWAPSLGILCLVGAHILAAALGLYSSAPSVTVLEPSANGPIQGHLEIAVHASDGPTGVGVRQVEYQLDTKAGTWLPLRLEPKTMTYRGQHDLSAVKGGSHALFLRASDFAGNLRTVSVSVLVNPMDGQPTPLAGSEHEVLADNKSIPQG